MNYAGSHGIHLYDITGGNPGGGGQAYLGDPFTAGVACVNNTYTDPTTGAPACYTGPNAQHAGINIRGSAGTSSYNALNARFETHILHGSGLSLTANYTYAHSLDDLFPTTRREAPDSLEILDISARVIPSSIGGTPTLMCATAS